MNCKGYNFDGLVEKDLANSYFMVSTYTAIEKGEQEGVSLDIEKVLGRQATSLEQLLEEYIGEK